MSFAAGIGAGLAIGMGAGLEAGRRDARRSIAEYCDNRGITAHAPDGSSVLIEEILTRSRRTLSAEAKRTKAAVVVGLSLTLGVAVALYFLR
jgi:hypothetical protein